VAFLSHVVVSVISSTSLLLGHGDDLVAIPSPSPLLMVVDGGAAVVMVTPLLSHLLLSSCCPGRGGSPSSCPPLPDSTPQAVAHSCEWARVGAGSVSSIVYGDELLCCWNMSKTYNSEIS
jgi:hypothetical protein